MNISQRIAAVTLAVLLASCSGDITPPDQRTADQLTFAELSRRFSQAEQIPAEALSAQSSDIIAKYQATLGTTSILNQQALSLPLTDAELLQVIEDVAARYPNFANLTELDLQRIGQEFGGLSRTEVVNNLDTIRDLYEAKARLDMYNVITRQASKPSPSSPRSSLSGASACDVAMAAKFPLQYKEVWKAKAAAEAYTSQYASKRGASIDDGTRANAFKHAIWNVLIASYTGAWFANVDELLSWTKQVTDAHECGKTDLPALMDYHNNEQGRQFFKQFAYVWVSFVGYRSVRGPDEVFINSQLSAKADRAVKVGSGSEMNNRPSSLVFTKGN